MGQLVESITRYHRVFLPHIIVHRRVGCRVCRCRLARCSLGGRRAGRDAKEDMYENLMDPEDTTKTLLIQRYENLFG